MTPDYFSPNNVLVVTFGEDPEKDENAYLVTHNMQQAARVADRTAFFSVERSDGTEATGILVEYDLTPKIFTQPSDQRTEDYVTGRFG